MTQGKDGRRSRQEVFEDYDGFVEKFKPKKTTDDCYTPPEVYECIKEWVNDNICPLDGLTVHRPFYPGGDFERDAENYGSNDIVIDNPPFSILAKIQDFYLARGIRYFLFAPALTLFSAPRPGVTYICAHAEIIYENGANVRTSFVTNMEGKHRIILAGDLHKKVEEMTAMLHEQKMASNSQKRYNYPNEVITSAHLGRLAVRGLTMKIPFDEVAYTRKLDNAPKGSHLFGGGYFISERAAAERAAAERAAAERAAAERAAAERAAAAMAERYRVELSPRELLIVASPGEQSKPT